MVTKGQHDDSVTTALHALGHKELRHPGSLPYPELKAGTDTIPEIEHIVLLMLENHSYDNLFGMLSRGDGFEKDHDGNPLAFNPYPNGFIQHAFKMPTTCQLPQTPSQEWTASHNAYNNGSMDGFVRTLIAPIIPRIVGGVAMGYYTADHLPFTMSLAEEFPIGDRWFSSTLCQTFPNRRYLIAGTSLGETNDLGIPDADTAPAGTIFNLLDKYGIQWTNYVSTYPSGATPFLFGNDNATENVNRRDISQFFIDAAAGTLPKFSFVEPNYGNQSQENPQNVVLGEAFLHDVVQAIGTGPGWLKTLFMLMYDEHGGYYDHVSPPSALKPDDIAPIAPGELQYEGFARYGIRVPSVVVSPYAKPRYVSRVLYDHTSVLATIERKYNLPALTYRDANANDILDFLDMEAMSKRRPTFEKLPKLASPGNSTAALALLDDGTWCYPTSRYSFASRIRKESIRLMTHDVNVVFIVLFYVLDFVPRHSF